MSAKELNTGLQFKLLNNSFTTLILHKKAYVEVSTYNFEVADVHNYYVGEN